MGWRTRTARLKPSPFKATNGSTTKDSYQGAALAVPKGNIELRAFRLWGSKGVNELQFQIKDQEYFLAFVEQEKRWYVFAPTPQGVHRIPVYVDAVNWGAPAALATETSMSS